MKSLPGITTSDLIIIFLALFSISMHLLVINNLEYHRDELLYFSLGLHPAAGYATVPPLIGWVAWLMQNTFGYSLFAVRFFPAILSGVMVILVSAIARELGGTLYARILAGIGLIISGFALRTFSLFQPVHIDLLFWTLIIYLVIRYINTSSGRFLVFLGIAAGAVSYERIFKNIWLKILLPLLLVFLTIPILPMGLPVFKTDGLVKYFRNLELKYGIEIGRRFEDGSIHSLPQDYADMLGWKELTAIANKAWQMVPDKQAGFIYCENYGQAGAITIIGKKYGLPEAVSFHESFIYWFPQQFTPDIKFFIYINDELGDDIKSLFRKITNIGSITNPDAREYGTLVYLCEEPKMSFNAFWTERVSRLRTEN